MKIALLTGTLESGGAERQLGLLARELSRRGHAATLFALSGGGALRDELLASAVRVVELGRRATLDLARPLSRLVEEVRAARPAVLYSFLAVPNVLAAMLRPLVAPTRIVWGVRASDVDLSQYGRLDRLVDRAERLLARRAHAIIANSHSGLRHAAARGFPEARLRVIHNGIDTERFRPDPEARRRSRAQWGVGDAELVVGHVGRIDPMKDHLTFLRAARAVRAAAPDVRFVCVGGGVAAKLRALEAEAAALGVPVLFAGERRDMPSVYPAFDLLCSSSSSEGFSNAIAEAMSSGVPCAVTDVGDSSLIVGDTGAVAPPRAPEALAAAIEALLARRRQDAEALGRLARQRILERFGLDRLVDETLDLFDQILRDETDA